MLQLTFTLQLTIKGPFTTKSSGVGSFGVDAVLLRDRNGKPLLPGSQVRGRVRESLEEFASAIGGSEGETLATFVRNAFGPPVTLDEFEPMHGHRAGAIHFSDFTGSDSLPAGDDAEQLLTRIQVDSATGTARSHALLVLETAAEPARPIQFEGEVELFERDIDSAVTAADYLFKALDWVPSLGSFRTVGFGTFVAVRVTDVKAKVNEAGGGPTEKLVQALDDRLAELYRTRTKMAHFTLTRSASEETVCSPRSRFGFVSVPSASGICEEMPPADLVCIKPVAARAETTSCCHLELQLDAPFVVGQRRTNRNITRSVDYLSGAVIKGALAAQLQRWLSDGREGDSRTDVGTLGQGTRWESLCLHLSQIRFCTALPIRKDQPGRPVVQPLSLVKFGDRLRDAALARGPCLLKVGTDTSAPVAPAFSIDWKDPATSPWDGGLARPVKELRFHTAMDDQIRTARHEHLFAHELVHPIDKDDKEKRPLVWRGAVDLSRVPEVDRNDVRRQLEEVFGFVELRFGKTKARAKASLATSASLSASQVSSTTPLAGNRWVIVLQSPAFLADPRTVRQSWEAGEPDGLKREYERVFEEFSGGSLRLLRYFADQSLHGGFLAQRTARDLKQPYNPLFVTEPGSVFVLEASGDPSSAAGQIEAWFTSGLPLPVWAKTLYGETYRTNPFLPEDGFGEIAVNLSLHETLRINDDEAEYVD